MLRRFGRELARHRILHRLNRVGALWLADLQQSPKPNGCCRKSVAIVRTLRKLIRRGACAGSLKVRAFVSGRRFPQAGVLPQARGGK